MADDEEVARLEASPARRVFALAVLGALGILMIWLALSQPGGTLVLKALVLALGVGALLAARGMQRATARAVILDGTGLRDSAGVRIAEFAAIGSVDRGTFAFKPSNGFLVRLNRPGGRRLWQPGLYWRVGRRIGIGGVAHAAQAKAMADALAIMLATRQADDAPEGDTPT